MRVVHNRENMIGWIVISIVVLQINGQYRSSCWSENATTVAGSPSGVAGPSLVLLNTALGIDISDDNHLFIADSYNNRILFLDLNSSASPQIFANGLVSMNQPTDVFVTNTSVYVLDGQNFRVLKFSKNGSNVVTVAGVAGSMGTAASFTNIGTSYFIFMDQNDRLFVSDTNNHRILLFPPNSTSGSSARLVAGSGVQGSTLAQLSNPNGVFVLDNGTMYIADLRNNRILKWLPNATSGQRVAGDGTQGNGSSQMYFPTSVVVDSDEFLYVTELKNFRVTRWTPQSSVGVCIAGCTGGSGNAPNQLKFPQKLVFDQNGSLFVSDQSNNRVQKFALIGNCEVIATSVATTVSLSTGVVLKTSTESMVTSHPIVALTTTAAGAVVGTTTARAATTPGGADTTTIAPGVGTTLVSTRVATAAATTIANAGVGTTTAVATTTHAATTVAISRSAATTPGGADTTTIGPDIGTTAVTAGAAATSIGDDATTPGDPSTTAIGVVTGVGSTTGSADAASTIVGGATTSAPINTAGRSVVITTIIATTAVTAAGSTIDSTNSLVAHTSTIVSVEKQTSLSSSESISEMRTASLIATGLIPSVETKTSTMHPWTSADSSPRPVILASNVSNICPPSMFGQGCNFSSNPCVFLRPCLNGGVCTENQSFSSGFLCQCPQDVDGLDCEIDQRPCQPWTCFKRGKCNVTLSRTFQCHCDVGYQGERCEALVNYCPSPSCSDHGVCFPYYRNSTCQCLEDFYYGTDCEFLRMRTRVLNMVNRGIGYLMIVILTSFASFIILMDVLKYAFGIDPVQFERQLQPKREKKNELPRSNVAIRFTYVS